jgi:hypothetical protein
MSALANGTYFITSSGSGGDRFYLGFSSGATGEALVINTFTGSESHQVVVYICWQMMPILISLN